jgi:fatty-acid desaturase
MLLCHVMALGCFAFHSWRALALVVPVTLGATFGITIGFHRLFTHRSFRTYRGVERLLAFWGTMAVQRGPIEWVALHRMHHAHPDTAADPHDASRGFWHSHIGWLFTRPPAIYADTTIRRFARDMTCDPFLVWLSRDSVLYGMQFALFGGLLATLGPAEAFACVFGRLVAQYHATFFINSACHRFGYRNYDTPDSSTNLWWAAWLTFGEGWHNNHHSEPGVAINTRRRAEIDPSGWLILGLERLGLAWDLRRPTRAPRSRIAAVDLTARPA